MANRNRSAGIAYETQIAREFREMGYEAVTSRYASRQLDDAGVDLVTDFPLAPQMKVSVNQPNCHTLLTETEAEIVFFKKVEKSKKNFIAQGEYVFLRKDDLYKLLKLISK